MKTTILISALAGVLLCGLAVAGGKSTGMMEKVDSNGDGRISMAEHDAHAKMMFGMMDSDKDGFVSAAEMEAGHAKMMGEKKMDHGKMDHGKMDHSKMGDGVKKDPPAK